MKKIQVMSEKMAELYSYKNNIPKSLIVSIRCPEEDRPKFNKTIEENNENSQIYKIFEMQFNDLETDLETDQGILKAPTLNDFKGLKQFIDDNITAVEQIVVHCGAGVSRSAGCALAIAEYLNIDNNIRTSNKYVPNMWVYKLTKQELGIDKNKEYYENIFR